MAHSLHKKRPLYPINSLFTQRPQMLKKCIALGTFAFTAATGTVNAASIFIDFNGSQNGALIANFYNGGTDSFGNAGANYGVTFNEGATVRIDYGKTYLTNVTSMSVRDGFMDGLTFQYGTLGGSPGNADMYDFAVRLDTHIDPSYYQRLNNTYFNDCTRYAGGYCMFTGGFARVYDDATAYTVSFVTPPDAGGNDIRGIGVDTITFGIAPIIGPGSNIPANSRVGNDPYLAQVPEPTTTALFGLGLLATLAATRRRKGR